MYQVVAHPPWRAREAVEKATEVHWSVQTHTENWARGSRHPSKPSLCLEHLDLYSTIVAPRPPDLLVASGCPAESCSAHLLLVCCLICTPKPAQPLAAECQAQTGHAKHPRLPTTLLQLPWTPQ